MPPRHWGDVVPTPGGRRESNDLFYAHGPEGIALFDAAGKPVGGDLTHQVQRCDAGAEVNEAPGVEPNQAP
ncbi:MAG: hypothetical protein BroJett029_04600 [Alphaproteobacteria bacterium]|nr:MAG: hypothetical protein BroJett029_04600 [Alphaproteobacteria bacterium]